MCLADGASFVHVFDEVGHRFERCGACGFTRMADPKTSDDLGDYYAEERSSGEAAWQEHPDNLVKFSRVLARLERHVLPGRFLDVGCSLGTSLVAARDRSWRSIGIELSRPVAEFGREKWGVDIREQTLEELREDPDFAAASFDLIFMHHTLEHVPDPAATIEQCFELLRPGGVMFQAVPNHGALKAKLFGGRWSYGVTHEHVSHFSTATLRRLLERVGFEVLEVRTPDSASDPRLLHDIMYRCGQRDRLVRWTGSEGVDLDTERYIRFITDRPIPNFVVNRLWPARLSSLLGLGQEVHMTVRKPDAGRRG